MPSVPTPEFRQHRLSVNISRTQYVTLQELKIWGANSAVVRSFIDKIAELAEKQGNRVAGPLMTGDYDIHLRTRGK